MTDHEVGKETNPLKQAALDYIGRGWAVIPIHTIRNGVCSCGYDCKAPGKHPISRLVPTGLKEWTKDPSTVESWWSAYPDANIGIVTGKVSDLYVIDIDNKRSVEVGPGILMSEGESSLRRVQDERGLVIPQTLESETGSGGRHLLFRLPPDQQEDVGNRAHVYDSIDIRGDGGYIVAAPSVHASGSTYRWNGDPGVDLAPFPRWFIQRPDESSISHTFAEEDVVGEGGRNDYLYRYGSSLLARGRTFQEVADAVFGANYRVCSPPLDREELSQIIGSLQKLPVNPEPEIDLESFKSRDTNPDIPELGEGEDLAISLVDLLANPPKANNPIIGDGILDEGDGFILAGQPNLGKSWIALDMALSVGMGDNFLSRFPTERGLVLYVDEEGSAPSMYKRMRMLLNGRGADPEEIAVNLVIQRGIKLDNPKGRTTLQRIISRYRPKAIILDSMIRFHSGDENSSKDMSAFFEVSKTIQNVTGAAVIFLHHIRKPSKEDLEGDLGNLMRGSGDIRGWPDGVMVAVPGGSDTPGIGMTVHHIKSRNHRKQDPFKIGLYIDDDRDAAFVTYNGAISDKKKDGNSSEKEVMDAIIDIQRKNTVATMTDLLLHLEMDELEIGQVLSSLLASDQIVQSIRGNQRNGKKEQAWVTKSQQAFLLSVKEELDPTSLVSRVRQ